MQVRFRFNMAGCTQAWLCSIS
uniref:Uncharacterized protein n=1 Tax=Anguilla anguilla TaxID=7936 RepID=A0A0E9R2M3_ANGAN